MEARQAKNKMKEKVVTTTNYVAIAPTLKKIQNDVATQLTLPPTSRDNCEVTQKIQEKICKFSSADTSWKSFPNSWTVQGFCCFRQRKKWTRRIHQFCLVRDASLLETSKDVWFVDGTFKQCPDMFHLLYTINITVGGYNLPYMYALSPNKTEKTYLDFSQALLHHYRMQIQRKIVIEFEKVAVNALSTAFTAAQITGSYFRLCQSVLRKINEVGLKKDYTTTPELALALKMEPATAF